MSLEVLLYDGYNRSIALVSSTHALVFRHNWEKGVRTVTQPRCIVEFVSLAVIDVTDYRPVSASKAHGTLGLVSVNSDTFICIISRAARVATVRPGEDVQRIISVDFYCLNRKDFDYKVLDDSSSLNYISDYVGSLDHTTKTDQQDSFEHPCLAMKKLLSGGTFYFSVDFDLTHRLQQRFVEESAFDVDNLKSEFLWNSYLIDPLILFRSRLSVPDQAALDASQILTSAIQGYVSSVTIPASSSPFRAIKSHMPSQLTLISRLSCRRAGTRFHARGIDDDGHVANFVETETVYWFPSGLSFSFAQVRGSLPIFWEQSAGFLPQQQKIQITRSVDATQPAFKKHIENLELNYGAVLVLNLLSASKAGEAEITERYNLHIQMCSQNQGVRGAESTDRYLLQRLQFDFHAETRGSAGFEAADQIRQLIRRQLEGFSYFLSQAVEASSSCPSGHASIADVILQQEGVFRTNCLDCLDRTNLIQTIISRIILELYFSDRGERGDANFWVKHSSLWADNGDALSKIYAGTGALKTSYTRHGKMSLAGAIADARKSATRMYINNFVDKGRQNTIDVLLGRSVDQTPVQLYDPITEYMNIELQKRLAEYTSTKEIKIWVGTLNLNGRTDGLKEDLSPWLFPPRTDPQSLPQVVAIGFQEVVELSPQQIMSTDPARKLDWESAIKKTLNGHARKQHSKEYVLLRSGQLVGAVLMVFVQTCELSMIKNVEGSVKKTGLSGMAGNKGAVAIRMDYANTHLCFVTAHLAAGFANYDERNRDYQTISHGLRFQRNRSIDDHETVIWLGDFNYRIGLSNEKVHRFLNAGDLGILYKNDQLNLQMLAGQAFPFYREANVTFMPTYKYDVGSEQYDTSEKARIPAWCDRVLCKGDNLRQVTYDTAPVLRFSDHRPVFATFECAISVIDLKMRAALRREIYADRKAFIERSEAAYRGDKLFKKDGSYDSITPGFPRSSSERRKWWLDYGHPARSVIADTSGTDTTMKPNPNRANNPFRSHNGLDWLTCQAHPNDCQNTGNQDHPDATVCRDDFPTPKATYNSVTRKAAPPIPPKPTKLIKVTEVLEDIRVIETGGTQAHWDPQSFQSSYQTKSQQRIAERAVSHDNCGKQVGTGDGAGTRPNLDRPSLPPRPMINLMDQDKDDKTNIPSLKPSRLG